MTIQLNEDQGVAPTPERLGIGMRLSVHPHCDAFEEAIVGALADVADAGLGDELVVETDEVSTYVGALGEPAEERLAVFAVALITAAHRRCGEGHVVAHLLLSRGCPGEVGCTLETTGLSTPLPISLDPSGIRAAAQWSLYPLLDGDSNGGDHMAHIEAAIESAKKRGLAASANHYATKLTGDLCDVVSTAVDAWAQVGAVVPHVVTHLSISVGSPSVVIEEGIGR